MNKDIKEITEQLEKGVKEVFTSGKYKEYLDFMCKFHNYSVNNIILIMMQNPQASLVAGYKAWQTKFKRQVRKGEKGMTILAPCPHKRTIEEDGEEKEIIWNSFRAVKVFDISQTDGDAVPEIATTLSGDVKNYEELFDRLKNASPVPVSFEKMGSANGYFHSVENRIAIKEGMSKEQTIKTAIHEIAHAMLHCENGEEEEADRNTREVQAESVAYTVCKMLGIDSSDYSFGYVAGWSKDKEVKELSESMEVIRRTATEIIDKIRK